MYYNLTSLHICKYENILPLFTLDSYRQIYENAGGDPGEEFPALPPASILFFGTTFFFEEVPELHYIVYLY